MNGDARGTRTYIEVDGREYLLGPDQDRIDVMSRIEEAVRSGPAFVDLSSGDRHLSVLVSHQSRIVITEQPVSPSLHAHAQTDMIADWDL